MKSHYKALGRLKSGQMNRTEEKYSQRLELLKKAGEVLWYQFEPCNLKLADKCFYRVDFLVLNKNHELEAHEVKGGYVQDDAIVKLKTAAEKFPFRFLMAQWKGKEWIIKEY